MNRAFRNADAVEAAGACLLALLQWRVASNRMVGAGNVYALAVSELAFYLLLYLVGRRTVRWLGHELPRTSIRPSVSVAVHATAAMVLITLALAPWLFYGYGWKRVDVLRTLPRVHLGAIVPVSPVLQLGDVVPVTYHHLVEWLIRWPTLCLFSVPAILRRADAVFGFPGVMWIASLVYYGAAAALIAVSGTSTRGTPALGMGARRPRRRARLIAAGVLVVTIQYLLVAIPSVEPHRFTRSAVELQRTDSWRYGYVLQHHGAVLVKARRVDGDDALIAPDRRDRIASLMLGELRARPWKATLELMFYAALFGLWRAGRSPLVRALGPDRTRLWRCVSAGIAAAFFVSAAIAPFLLAGYGEPLFSTLAGPGALSSSALLPRTTSTFMPSVSYGMLLQAVLIWPLMATEMFSVGDGLDKIASVIGLRGTLWMLGTVFWGVLTAAVSWFGYRPRLLEAREHGGHM